MSKHLPPGFDSRARAGRHDKGSWRPDTSPCRGPHATPHANPSPLCPQQPQKALPARVKGSVTGSIQPRAHGPQPKALPLCAPRPPQTLQPMRSVPPSPTAAIPKAPSVYRPSPVSKVLQAKQCSHAPMAPNAKTSRQPPNAPSVYRPQPAPKVLQPKTAGPPKPTVSHTRQTPATPPVYRPQPAPRVLQAKMMAHAAMSQRSQTKVQSFGPSPPGLKGAVIQPHMITGGVADSVRQKSALPGQSLGSAIQMMRMPLPPAPPTGSNIRFRDSGTFLENGRQKKRAGTVEAFLDPNQVPWGSVPTVSPLGWEYAGEVAVQKPNKPFKAHRGWVRFHLLNENLGGPGNDVRNLVPTKNATNSCPEWRSFEEKAKDYLLNKKKPIAFEVTVEYHQNIVRQPPEEGDTELEKFPRKIEAEFMYYENGWQSPQQNGRAILNNIAPPPTTPGYAEFYLSSNDCNELALTTIFGIDSWLAKRILDVQHIIASVKPATVQALYDFLYDNVQLRPGNSKTPRADLNMAWPILEVKLNKMAGAVLRIYQGWTPNGSTAQKVVKRDFSLQAISIAASHNQENLKNMSRDLNIDLSVLSCFSKIPIGPGAPTDADALYRVLTKGLNRFAITKFDSAWPQVERALEPVGKYISGVKQTQVVTQTMLRELEERERLEEEERRLAERAQEQKILDSLRKELDLAYDKTLSGQVLEDEQSKFFKTKAKNFLDEVYEKGEEKLGSHQLPKGVDLISYYSVYSTLKRILADAKKPPEQRGGGKPGQGRRSNNMRSKD